MTETEALATFVPELEQIGEQAAAKIIQTEAPIAIKWLQNLEKNGKPGFLDWRDDVDEDAVTAINIALTWANGINPPTPLPATV